MCQVVREPESAYFTVFYLCPLVAKDYVGNIILHPERTVKTVPICGGYRFIGKGGELSVGGVAHKNMRTSAFSIGNSATEKVVSALIFMYLGSPEIPVRPKLQLCAVHDYLRLLKIFKIM